MVVHILFLAMTEADSAAVRSSPGVFMVNMGRIEPDAQKRWLELHCLTGQVNDPCEVTHGFHPSYVIT